MVTAKTRTSFILNSPARCKLHQMQVIAEDCSSDNVLTDRVLRICQLLTDEMKS